MGKRDLLSNASPSYKKKQQIPASHSPAIPLQPEVLQQLQLLHEWAAGITSITSSHANPNPSSNSESRPTCSTDDIPLVRIPCIECKNVMKCYLKHVNLHICQWTVLLRFCFNRRWRERSRSEALHQAPSYRGSLHKYTWPLSQGFPTLFTP